MYRDLYQITASGDYSLIMTVGWYCWFAVVLCILEMNSMGVYVLVVANNLFSTSVCENVKITASGDCRVLITVRWFRYC